MISPERFIARSSEREAWLAARDMGVTATMVANAATSAGFDATIAEFKSPKQMEPNAYMNWGNEREPVIASVVKERFGIMPNDWLIAKDELQHRWQMATPDGLSLDHKWIAEIKTTGKRFEKIPLRYMRQIQWQLHVTGAERCLFAFEERLDGVDGFVPGFDVECSWVDRDDKLIRDLIDVAERLQEHRVFTDWVGEDN